MTETVLLTNHQAIRDWAAARIGMPVIKDQASLIGNDTAVLMIEFGTQTYQDNDNDGSDRPDSFGKPRQVDWDEWFEVFDEHELALVVSKDVPNQRDQFHEIVRR